MVRPITAITRNLVNLIYPLHCASCGTTLEAMNGSGICAFCEPRIKRNPKPYCASCGRPAHSAGERCEECLRLGTAFDMARSACIYEGVLKDLIHLFKYKGRVALSGILCGLMTRFIEENPEFVGGVDIITFVPLYNGWLHRRDYNHSGVLARSLSKSTSIPAAQLLDKKLRTRSQNELSREERLTNLVGAFGMNGAAAPDGAVILLVDDVMTTGATLNECARVLKSGGAKEVRCLTLARGI